MSAYDAFNTRERELMIGAWHTISWDNVQLDVDYPKLANLANINAPKTASNRWGEVKKKIRAAIEDNQIASLNESESEIACLVWQCTKEPVGPDYDAMVQLGITKTKKTASNRWGDLKKKFADGGPSTPGASSAKAKTPRSKKSTTGSKRKAAAAADVGDDGNNAHETPTKRAKRAPASSKLTKEATTSDDAVEDDQILLPAT